MYLDFPSIQTFDGVIGRKLWQLENEPITAPSEFSLRPKIKLHGTNIGVGIGPDGTWVQSRSMLLGPDNDHHHAHASLDGFSKRLLEQNKESVDDGLRITIYGEWAGTGVAKKDAVTQIGKNVFFPFAVAIIPPDYVETDDVRKNRSQITVVTDPNTIKAIIGFEDDLVVVLPWAGKSVTFFPGDLSRTASALDEVNQAAEDIGIVDPFIKELFGVEGPGEGLVFVPEAGPQNPITLEDYSNTAFKAKAERHRVKKSAKAANAKTEIPQDVQDFVDVFATENRMEQMFNEKVGGVLERRLTGDFVQALIADVMKESQTERGSLDVNEKVLKNMLGHRAKTWYLAKCENDWRPSP